MQSYEVDMVHHLYRQELKQLVQCHAPRMCRTRARHANLIDEYNGLTDTELLLSPNGVYCLTGEAP